MSNLELAYPEPQYRDRLMSLVYGAVHRGCTSHQVKVEIEKRRELEGDVVAEDFRKLCRERWRRLGL